MKVVILILFVLLILSCSKSADNSQPKDISENALLERSDDIDIVSDDVSHNVWWYENIVDRAIEQYAYSASDDYMLIINTTEQMMYLLKGNTLVDEYVVSTGKTGEGSQQGSGKTPLGYHRIVEKIGDGAPIGAIFVGKKNTGKLSPIYTDTTDIDDDPVVTRIMSLDGLEEGYNKGGSVDSYKRFIYIHGTHEEGLLGTKTSHGCIRMKNTEVVELFGILPYHTLVYITQ